MNQRRWKLLSVFLGASTAFFAYQTFASRAPADAAAKVDRSVVPKNSAFARRQLRIPAGALGLREDHIIAQLKASTSAAQVILLCEKLGFVGTDNAVEALKGLTNDRRYGVAHAAFQAIGHIGTSRATRFLLELEAGGTPRERGNAIGALGLTGAESARAKLMELAADRTEVARNTAIHSLGEIGGDEAVPLLQTIATTGNNNGAHQSAIGALANIGTDAADHVLRELTRSKIEFVRWSAIEVLGRRDEGVEPILALLDDDSSRIVARAIQMVESDEITAAMPKIVELSRSASETIRRQALSALGTIGRNDDAALERLREAIQSNNANDVYSATTALAAMATDAARDVLVDIVMSPAGNSHTRSTAIYSLRQFGGPDVEAALTYVAQNAHGREREVALNYLVSSGSDAASDAAIAILTETSKNGAQHERHSAIRMLGSLATPEAIAVLHQLAASKGQDRVEAVNALTTLGEAEDASSYLADSLLNGGRSEASTAAAALARLGNEDARSALLAALRSENDAARGAAMDAVSSMRIDGEFRSALLEAADKSSQWANSALTPLLRAGGSEGVELARRMIDDPKKRSSSVFSALANAGTPEARELLISSARNGDSGVRSQVAWALSNIGGEEGLRALKDLATDSSPAVRSSALQGIGSVGTKEAIETLIRSTNDSESSVRNAAISALSSASTAEARRRVAELMFDSDENVATTAINYSHQGDPASVAALRQILGDPSRSEDLRRSAGNQLRNYAPRMEDSDKALLKELEGSPEPIAHGSHHFRH